MEIAFIGLGLMGGSVAKALRKSNPDNRIIAIDTNAGALKMALDLGVIDYGSGVIDENLSSCDVIFLCAPVDNNTGILKDIAKYLKPDSIITDIGSVKGKIHECIEKMGLSSYFVGGHPMAGSEKSGFENSNEHLLENAFYILTTNNPSDKKVDILTGLVKQTGAIPLVLSPDEHDFYTAGISHLPHLIASQLVNLIEDNDVEEGYMKMIAAGGFKDITRIASSNPLMWQQICNENADNIHILLQKYIEILKDTDEKLINNDKDFVYDMFVKSGNYRSSFADVSAGPIKKVSCIYCDLADESGAIATIATFLAKSEISIKNIGIIHNREYEDGALRIEFYNDDDMRRAEKILQDNNYSIYKR